MLQTALIAKRVTDGDLTPGQTVTLEDETGARVVDRHRVVLERHSKSGSSVRFRRSNGPN